MAAAQLPREDEPARGAARERLSRDILGYAIAGWACVMMVVFSWIVFGLTGMNGPGITPVLMALVFFGGAGWLMLRKFYGTRALRRCCVDRGMPCVGRVVAQGRAFNPFSSSRKYTVTVEYHGDRGPLRAILSSTDPSLHHRAPLGTTVPGWVDPRDQQAFFPLELGL